MKRLVFIFFAVLFLSSCSKIDQEILSEGMWKYSGGTYQGTDVLTFSKGGTSLLRNDTVFMNGKTIGLAGYYNLFKDEIVLYSLSGDAKTHYCRK